MRAGLAGCSGSVRACGRGGRSAAMGKRVALVLAGCGVFDGSEIHEASAALVHLSRGGAEVGGRWASLPGPPRGVRGAACNRLPGEGGEGRHVCPVSLRLSAAEELPLSLSLRAVPRCGQAVLGRLLLAG